MGRPRGDDDGEAVVPLSALERLFEGEADPANLADLDDPEPEEETSPEPAPSSGGADA